MSEDNGSLCWDHGSVGVWYGSRASAATVVQPLTALMTEHK